MWVISYMLLLKTYSNNHIHINKKIEFIEYEL